ncbi:hypothetical protein EYV94_14975 [Puteibacter caeruleilacunae]|nr:hypothetical protein EYV94_14975 [Puteibacter caeruleilacunae]
MKNKLLLLFFAVLFGGCEETESEIPKSNKSKLIINWEESKSSSWYTRQTAKIYLYNSEEEYNKPMGKASYCIKVSDIDTESQHGKASSELMIPIENIEPARYWVRIFNVCRNEYLIEHNQNTSFLLEKRLIEGATTTVSLKTECERFSPYLLNKIEIFDLPSSIKSVEGKVSVKLWKSWDIYVSDDELLDEQEIALEDGRLTYNLNGITIDSYTRWGNDFVIGVSEKGSSNVKYYEVNNLNLLRTNAYLGEEYIKMNNNNIELKLYVSWNTK